MTVPVSVAVPEDVGEPGRDTRPDVAQQSPTPARRPHQPLGRDTGAVEERRQLRARLVVAHHADGHRVRSQRAHIVSGIGATTQPYLAVREAKDEDGSLARDARGFAVEVLIGDEVAHDDDAPTSQPRHHVQDRPGWEHHARRRASAQSTASSRSSAT